MKKLVLAYSQGNSVYLNSEFLEFVDKDKLGKHFHECLGGFDAMLLAIKGDFELVLKKRTK